MIQGVDPTDIDLIVDIEKKANMTPWSHQMLSDAIVDDYEFLSYRNLDGQLCGYLIAQQVLDEASLLHIVVEPGFQSQGIGRELLVNWLGSLSRCVTKVWLEVRESNEIAQSLYQSQGFERVGERKNYYRLPHSAQKESARIYCLKRI